MKDVYLADLVDRAHHLQCCLVVVRKGRSGWDAKWEMLREAKEEAQAVANILEREFCEAGIPT